MDQVTAVVDFGTSHTVVAVSGPGLPAQLVSVDGDPWFPSAFFLTREGHGVVGKDALRLGRAEPARLERRPKARIDEDEVLLGDTVVQTSQLVRTVLVRAIAEAVTASGALVAHLVLTHPADWGPTRLGRLLSAAQGLVPRLSTVTEPVAAAAWFAAEHGLPVGSVLAVLDLGGGTCDVALVRREETGLGVLTCAGLPDLGGDDLDQRIVEHLTDGREDIARHVVAGAPTGQLPAEELAAVSRFRDDVRSAKEVLSRHPQADVVLPYGLPDVLLTRTEFEERVRPDLTRAVELLDETVRAAGLSTSDIAAVHLVGGSSRVPLLAQLLAAWADVPVRLADQPEAVVTLGAEVTVRPAASPTASPAVPPGERDPDLTGPVSAADFGQPVAVAPPADRVRRVATIAAVAIVAIALLGLAALIDLRGFGGTVAGDARAPAGAGPRLTLPAPRPGDPVSVPGLSTERLPLVEERTYANYVYQESTVQWRLDTFEDGAELSESLAEQEELAPDYHWALVRYTVRTTEALPGDPELDDQLYLVDDHGLMISPLGSFKSPANSGSVYLPDDCPEPGTEPVPAGTELAKCALFAVPDATPVREVVVSFHSNDNPLPSLSEATVSRGMRVAVTAREATERPPAEPDGTRPAGSPVPMQSNQFAAEVAVVDLVEDSSAYVDDSTTIILGGNRGMVARVAVRLTEPAPATSLSEISVVLLDDRGAPIDPAVPLQPKGCVNSYADTEVSGTVGLCVLFAVPTETTATMAVVKLGEGTQTWRLP